MDVKLTSDESPIVDGNQVSFTLKQIPGFRLRWTAEYQHCDPDSGFTDIQITGPFKEWRHRHSFTHRGEHDELCQLEDVIEYSLPLSPLSDLIAGRFLKNDLRRTFAYRHQILAADLDRRVKLPNVEPMHVLVTGASGLVGEQLCAMLTLHGHRVTKVSRSNPKNGKDIVTWNTRTDQFDLSQTDPIDAVIHLAGANVAGGRWTKSRREIMLRSRVATARLLARELLERNKHPLKACVFASGVSCYTPDGIEKSELEPIDTSTVLGGIVDAWEKSADPFREHGVRTSHIRLGAVLTPAGGALQKLLPIIKSGLGGHIGNGRQAFPWITIDDAADLFFRATIDDQYHGSYNAIAPYQVDNATFTATLAKILKRPALIPVPKFVLRAAFGKMADEVLIQNMVPIPHRLSAEINYPFRFPKLEPALRHLLGRA